LLYRTDTVNEIRTPFVISLRARTSAMKPAIQVVSKPRGYNSDKMNVIDKTQSRR